jgi:DNA primase small subunit
MFQSENSPFLCQFCSSSKADLISIPCVKCIDGSKQELKKLLEFLTKDFGIERPSITSYFSGNNGFHVHVSDEQFTQLDSSARADLAGYILGAGLLPESVGVRKGSGGKFDTVKFPRGGIGYGWRNKMAAKLRIDSTGIIRMQNLVAQSGGYSGFKLEMEKNAKAMGSRIDSQVTTDVHRIFRMPGTLNSKSGLAKTRCADIGAFDPFKDSCVLGDAAVDIALKCPVKIRLKGKSFNLSKESAQLPAFAAVYLICKGLADTR